MSRKIVCVTLDMEQDYGDPEGNIRLLDNPDHFNRYTEIINRHAAKVTMFTVASLFDHFGDRFDRLSEHIPLEYAAHSYSHDPQNAASRGEIEKCTQAFKKFTGTAPLGYRAPIGQIDRAGLGHLMDLGFKYDASIYSSFRPGEFGYSNLDMPNTPFRIVRGDENLIEFPFTSLSGVRIVFGLSYIKLLGWKPYKLLWRTFGLPDIALLLAHPYDFYFLELAEFHPPSLEKAALRRNAKRAFEYFDYVLSRLKESGYEFVFLSELYESVHTQPDLPILIYSDLKK